MHVAITGASGFLGRYIARELVGLGHTCRGLIRSNSRHHEGKPAIEWVTGSMDDETAVRSFVAGADAVVHAALDHPGGGFQSRTIDVAAFVERNLIATIRLIEASRAAGTRRFVVISSGAVHDDILGDRPLDETHPLWPRSHYGATKAAIEAFVHSYGRGEGFAISALRPTAIYGLADPVAASRWFALIAAVVRGETVHCRQGGKQVHAGDVARAVALLLRTDGIAGEVYHCTDLFITERSVAELARSIAGSAAQIDGEAPEPRHPITCAKLKQVGMSFGGVDLLRATIAEIVHQIQTS